MLPFGSHIGARNCCSGIDRQSFVSLKSHRMGVVLYILQSLEPPASDIMFDPPARLTTHQQSYGRCWHLACAPLFSALFFMLDSPVSLLFPRLFSLVVQHGLLW